MPPAGRVMFSKPELMKASSSMRDRGDNQVLAVDLVHVELLLLCPEHFGHRGTEDVGVQQAHTVALHGQRYSQVAGNGRFAHAALA